MVVPLCLRLCMFACDDAQCLCPCPYVCVLCVCRIVCVYDFVVEYACVVGRALLFVCVCACALGCLA